MKCVIGRPPVSVGLFHLNVTDLLSKSTIPAKLKWVLKKQRASKNIDLTRFSWLAWRLVRSLGLHRLRLKKRTLNSSGWKFLWGGTKSFRIGSCRLVFHLNRGWLSLLVDRIHLKPKKRITVAKQFYISWSKHEWTCFEPVKVAGLQVLDGGCAGGCGHLAGSDPLVAIEVHHPEQEWMIWMDD